MCVVQHLHNMLGIPKDRVGVKISSWVEPEVELLLFVAFALAEYIGMNNIRVATKIPQEFKVYLIPRRPFWAQLQHTQKLRFVHAWVIWFRLEI